MKLSQKLAALLLAISALSATSLADEKKQMFYLIYDILIISNNYLNQSKNYISYGIIGNELSGKQTFINKMFSF